MNGGVVCEFAVKVCLMCLSVWYIFDGESSIYYQLWTKQRPTTTVTAIASCMGWLLTLCECLNVPWNKYRIESRERYGQKTRQSWKTKQGRETKQGRKTKQGVPARQFNFDIVSELQQFERKLSVQNSEITCGGTFKMRFLIALIKWCKLVCFIYTTLSLYWTI